mmetsp:Transcript_1235/g.2791  ORF Transcript_1235/g.2791 Transcript_1235/m.2791 type:complete len:213 (+) Transcript_1235:2238-2876(+)
MAAAEAARLEDEAEAAATTPRGTEADRGTPTQGAGLCCTALGDFVCEPRRGRPPEAEAEERPTEGAEIQLGAACSTTAPLWEGVGDACLGLGANCLYCKGPEVAAATAACGGGPTTAVTVPPAHAGALVQGKTTSEAERTARPLGSRAEPAPCLTRSWAPPLPLPLAPARYEPPVKQPPPLLPLPLGRRQLEGCTIPPATRFCAQGERRNAP